MLKIVRCRAGTGELADTFRSRCTNMVIRTLAATTQIEAWEYEGGAQPGMPLTLATTLIGTASQVEWAERIRLRVNAEFHRVAASFRAVARKQSSLAQADTASIIAILQEKRTEVLSRDQAGYFIHDWQDISDQVRLMIFHDARYPAIRARMAARQ